MELSNRDILQINATVIAGVFILLSIMFAGNSSFEFIRELAIFIYFVGGFFALSGFVASLAEISTNEGRKNSSLKTAKILMIAGFATLFIGFVSTGVYFMSPK